MNHPETHLVTASHGPRPAGRPDRCFYCGQMVGREHKLDCVMRERTVVIEVTLQVPIAVPESWDAGAIEFRYGDSSWCADNLIDLLENCTGKHCLCGYFESRFLREATAGDEQRMQTVIEGFENPEGRADA